MYRLLILILLSLLLPQTLEAYEHLRTDPGGQIYHWDRTKLPIKFVPVEQSTTNIPFQTFQQVTSLSMDTWSRLNCAFQPLMQLQPPRKNLPSPERDGLNVISIINNANEWTVPSSLVAYTKHYFVPETGEITEVDIALNAWQHEWGIKETKRYDLQSTLTHELGHALGIGHSKNPDATMFANVLKGETKKITLEDDDITGICNIYPKQPCADTGSPITSTKFCYNGRSTDICAEYHQTCSPCQKHDDCRGAKNFCLQLTNGNFCGFDCSSDKLCPSGYTCRPVLEQQQTVGHNCVPNETTCQGVAAFPCCIVDENCLPPYKCIEGQCIAEGTCVDQGNLCKAEDTCCANTLCVEDKVDARCRQKCNPLAPLCPGNLRCGFLKGTQEGACFPSINGAAENEDCSKKECELQLFCHPRDQRCRLICDPNNPQSCPTGLRCIKMSDTPLLGLCENETTGQNCTSLRDCSNGQICRNQQCTSCAATSECPPQYKCSQGTCLPPCSGPSTCPSNHSCFDGFCQPNRSCTLDSDCPTGMRCSNTTCRENSSQPCTNQDDCSEGFSCQNGACQDRCNNSCSRSQKCLGSSCVPKTCTNDNQCGSEAACIQGDCKRRDINCGGQGPCPEGKRCVQNICKAKVGYACPGDSFCASGICATDGNLKFCSQSCNPNDPFSCPENHFCTQLPTTGLGCWPQQYTLCQANNICTPKSPGCSCATSSESPFYIQDIVFFLLLLLGTIVFKNGRTRYGY